MAKRWYVVHAYSGFEQVMRTQERVALHEMEDRFGEILVPTEEVVEMREGKKRKSERKFYPGYVLVQMEMDDATWHLVKNTPRVLGSLVVPRISLHRSPKRKRKRSFVGRKRCRQAKPKTLFEPGEIVRVVEGPFADFNGVVEEVDYDKVGSRLPF